ncbi:MAG: hypothetical protein ACTMIR_00185 [Cellulomonadaceae bacterium]
MPATPPSPADEVSTPPVSTPPVGAPPAGAAGSDPTPSTAPSADAAAMPWLAWPLGQRVMIRRRIVDETHVYTDLLGEILDRDDSGVTLRTRRGDVRVPAAEIAIGKPVPPPPPRRRRRNPAADDD